MDSLDAKLKKIVENNQIEMNKTPSERREDKLKELNNKLLDARSKYESGPLRIENAEKQYYTLKDGAVGYEKRKFEKYKVEAENLKKEMLVNHQEDIKNTFHSLSYYNSQRTYSTNIDTVKLTMLKNIMKQLKQLQKENANKSTNNRKTYYVIEEQESVIFWLKFLNYCIISFIIVFIAYSVKEQHIDIYTYLFVIFGAIIVFYLEPLIKLIQSIPLSFNVYTAWGEDTEQPTSTFYVVLIISFILMFVIYKKNAVIDNYFK
uniref:Uncharacterized protein n=1 Tax=viral metagenome TaxID=1070528 RepID=A0A6C0B8L5_9ZZZZ